MIGDFFQDSLVSNLSSCYSCYVHMNRIGVLVELEGGDESAALDVAMHVAAMNPPFATPDQVPAEVLEKEKKLLTEQALESGKPAEIVEKVRRYCLPRASLYSELAIMRYRQIRSI